MRLLRSVVFMLAITASLLAQPSETKHTELSLSGFYQDFSFSGSSGSTTAFFISPRVGIYLVKGLALEPEATLMAITGSDPVYVLNGNITYNFISKARGVPFLLLGYGIANTVPFCNIPTIRTDFGIDVLNIGAGVKIYLSDDFALRLEYRYQKFSGSGEENDGFYSYQENVSNKVSTVQFGLCVLL